MARSLLAALIGAAVLVAAAPVSGARVVNPVPTPEFRSSISVLSPDQITAMKGVSWRPGCPVSLTELRLVEVSYVDFSGGVQLGTLVLHRTVAPAVVKVFAAIYASGFPIAKIRPIEAYQGDDDASTQDNNTAAFNCRFVLVTKSKKWSQHAFGKAVDINPVQNPYVYANGRTLDPAAQRFADRTKPEPGMILPGDVVDRSFRSIGWGWGGRWSSTKDYQHFSSTGR